MSVPPESWALSCPELSNVNAAHAVSPVCGDFSGVAVIVYRVALGIVTLIES